MHYHFCVSWDVYFTETAEQWLDALSDEDFDRVIAFPLPTIVLISTFARKDSSDGYQVPV